MATRVPSVLNYISTLSQMDVHINLPSAVRQQSFRQDSLHERQDTIVLRKTVSLSHHSCFVENALDVIQVGISITIFDVVFPSTCCLSLSLIAPFSLSFSLSSPLSLSIFLSLFVFLFLSLSSLSTLLFSLPAVVR